MDKDNIKTVKKLNAIETGNLVGYKIVTNNDVVIQAPVCDDNTDYQALLEWEAIDGNTIAEAD